MNLPVSVTIHPSQFPGAVANDLLESLRTRKVNHKFHYDSIKQTQKWLALHQAFSPSRTDADCAAVYDRSFDFVAEHLEPGDVHLIGLGCGGGQKDARLLQRLLKRMTAVNYTPMDVSVAMTLVGRDAAADVVGGDRCHPFVCDLAKSADLRTAFDPQNSRGQTRLYTFFGMIPNFEPSEIMPKLSGLVAHGDHLLFSANLAPGDDYDAGIAKILPLYDNDLTHDWLMTFLLDLGVERGDGSLKFGVEQDARGSGLKKVAARFHFARPMEIRLDGEIFNFKAGDDVQLFFSYRHSPATVRSLLLGQGLSVKKEWITASGEEGVFYCARL